MITHSNSVWASEKTELWVRMPIQEEKKDELLSSLVSIKKT